MTATAAPPELHALALAYAHHADRREPDLVAALFEPDGELRMARRGDDGPPMVSRGHRHIASAVGRLRQFDATFHLVANHSVELAGDEATGEVYCVAHHVAADGSDHVMYIRYLDRYRLHDGRWLFTERETFVEWTEHRPAAS